MRNELIHYSEWINLRYAGKKLIQKYPSSNQVAQFAAAKMIVLYGGGLFRIILQTQ